MKKETTKKVPFGESQIISRESEQMVLGCLISSETNFKKSFGNNLLEINDFYFIEHKTIFAALSHLYKNNSPCDIHLIAEQLKGKEHLEEIGGIKYLMDLAVLPGTSAYFESYQNQLKEISSRREFVYTCEALRNLALTGEKNVTSITDLAVLNFSQISKKSLKTKSLSLANLLKGSHNFLDILREKRKIGLNEGRWQIQGISTGYFSLDNILGGFRDENLIIIAARPSIGKTAFALNLLRNLGVTQRIPTAFFSLEMTANQLFLRLLSSQSGISASKIETGNISDSQFEQIETALQQLEKSPIYINDSCYDIAKIIAQMKLLLEEHQVKAFFIDYIGLIQPIKEREIKAYEIGDISRALKNFANEFHVPVICLAQLNRQAEQGGKPQLSMLKDSGNLEQDADSVIFLHRRDLYDPNDKPGQIEIIIAKNRHGATDTKFFQFKNDIGIISEFVEHPSKISWI